MCTAGVDADGNWIRIYPVQYLNLPETDKYKKYDLVEVDCNKATSDNRPESFRLVEQRVKIINSVPPDNNWYYRKQYLNKTKVYDDLNEIIHKAKVDKDMSLCSFKPQAINKIIIEKEDLNELDIPLLDQDSSNKELMNKILKQQRISPYKFKYSFVDKNDREANLTIRDWEIYELYQNCLEIAGGDKEIAREKVKDKNERLAINNDITLFLGTTKKWQVIGPNPFIIVGMFYPKKLDHEQPSLM